MRPSKFDFRFNSANVETESIMLESLQCRKIKVELLVCVYQRGTHELWSEERRFVSGLNGEIYEMSSPLTATKCNDEFTFTISKHFSGNEHEPPRYRTLQGIAHILDKMI